MPVRPPPLKLKYDNFKPLPLPSARKPPVNDSFFAKLYKANWRNMVIGIAGLQALRYAYQAYTAYNDSEIDRFEHAPQLAVISVALCVIQRFAFVRAYAFLAFLSAVLVTAASVLKTASFFLNAEELMYECVALALTGKVFAKSQFGRMWPSYAMGLRQAQNQCVNAWTHQSWAQIVYVFLFGFMPCMLHYLLAYTYYRQTTEVSHAAYLVARQPNSRGSNSHRGRNGGYARVSDGDVPCAEVTGRQRPEGRATQQRSARLRANALPASRDHCRPIEPPALVQPEPPIFSAQVGALLQSATAISSWLSPGPLLMASTWRAGTCRPIHLSCSGDGLMSARYDKLFTPIPPYSLEALPNPHSLLPVRVGVFIGLVGSA
ncbi:hypothetical protein BKA70DRAFT_1308018 [Coprinopsis sp. MPI-PUGE-AT-0042]|nr:hypothetical protein BKA70DRAFT_1308018 [Coprinopsis sp. MPI-PUGE-AT-0042]